MLSHPRSSIVTPDRTYTSADLDRASAAVARALVEASGGDDLRQARVAFLCPPGFAYVAVLRGIWRAGGVAVPLATSHPPAELEYVIRDSEASIVVGDATLEQTLAAAIQATGARFLRDDDLFAPDDAGSVSGTTQDRSAGRRGFVAPDDAAPVDASARALIIYTSGTTGRPKGVVTTHGNIAAQIGSLLAAWEWTPSDRTLLVLPLHHVHGIINVVGCALTAGATLEVLRQFDAEAAWDRLASGDITVFTAVPTIYRRLIQSWEAAAPDVQERRTTGCSRVRLMMSGSAALPVATLERWREITGHTLLERYGMTELGMALSNPLHGERRPGYVGHPLPGVEARIVGEAGEPVADGSPGELEVRGAGVFLEYWRRPDETRTAFRHGGSTALPTRWFRTGDVAAVDDGYYRLLGRRSVDIIKTGGFKVSALEIEEVAREHAAIADCAVVGAPDPDWGERVCIAVELCASATLTLADLQAWMKTRVAPYKLPRAMRCVPGLPRNAMGKVVKPEVSKLF